MTLLGLIGNPVSHSLSPLMHTCTASKLGLNLRYLTVEVPTAESVGQTLTALHDLGFRGLNVTIPYKEEAARHACKLSGVSELIGAVNVLTRVDDGWEGHNTDHTAVRDAVRERIGEGGFRALVMGAGGSARAVVAALLDSGAEEVIVANRTYSRALELANLFTRSFGAKVVAVPLERARNEAKETKVVVNTIPAGLLKSAELPLDSGDLRDDALLVDLVYGPEGSPMFRLAVSRGLALVDGIEVLARQAAHSFRLWTGIVCDHKSMEAVARFAIRRWHS
ncbi:MAG: shikimate dehydrogenase [Thaumarchaeota archaeon]|nr:shikimate dehydrogenase [Candidatus Calditenuaceae archaeon]MDW8187110.1 shikimate dehydrogenase [Nitrososphaerota archaeon]